MVKIVLGGPPKSGKSCLREGLKQAILGFRRDSPGIPYPYVITACPDGEGAWFQETMEKYPEIAKRSRFNRRRRNLWGASEVIRRTLTQFLPHTDVLSLIHI